MARALTKTGTLTVQPPCRPGKYDRWLDGAMWMLGPEDVPLRLNWERQAFRHALRSRARRRGLRVKGEWLEDGRLVVQALTHDPSTVVTEVLQPALGGMARGMRRKAVVNAK